MDLSNSVAAHPHTGCPRPASCCQDNGSGSPWTGPRTHESSLRYRPGTHSDLQEQMLSHQRLLYLHVKVKLCSRQTVFIWVSYRYSSYIMKDSLHMSNSCKMPSVIWNISVHKCHKFMTRWRMNPSNILINFVSFWQHTAQQEKLKWRMIQSVLNELHW